MLAKIKLLLTENLIEKGENARTLLYNNYTVEKSYNLILNKLKHV